MEKLGSESDDVPVKTGPRVRPSRWRQKLTASCDVFTSDPSPNSLLVLTACLLKENVWF